MSGYWDPMPGKVGLVSKGDLLPPTEDMVHELRRDDFTHKKVAWILLSELLDNATYATRDYIRELCANPNRWYPTGDYKLVILTDRATSKSAETRLPRLDLFLGNSCMVADYQYESCRYPQNWAKQNEFKDEPRDWFKEFAKRNYKHGDMLVKLPLANDEDRQPGPDAA